MSLYWKILVRELRELAWSMGRGGSADGAVERGAVAGVYLVPAPTRRTTAAAARVYNPCAAAAGCGMSGPLALRLAFDWAARLNVTVLRLVLLTPPVGA